MALTTNLLEIQPTAEIALLPNRLRQIYVRQNGQFFVWWAAYRTACPASCAKIRTPKAPFGARDAPPAMPSGARSNGIALVPPQAR